jgi:predicted permease
MKQVLRSLLRTPSLTVTAVVLLSIGIGATTAVFSVVNTVLLSPLPYAEPDRLVRMWTELSARNVAYFPESPGNLEDFRQQSTLFESIGGIFGGGATLTRHGSDPMRVQTGTVTWDFLAMLGIDPIHGRNFTATDGAFSASDVLPGTPFPASAFAAPRVVLLSHALWQREFGGRADVIGKHVEIEGFDVEVIGVLPPNFRLHIAPVTAVPAYIDFWTPLRVDLAAAPRTNVMLHMVGRVRAGVPLEQALRQIEQVGERIFGEHPVMRTAGARKHAMPYGAELVAEVRGVMWALLGAAGFVLLIACANVANLLLVRAAGRTRELAIRTALGANRRAVIRQLLMETAVLAALGAIGGLMLAHAGLALIMDAAPANIARLDAVGIDWRVLAFATVLAVATTLLAGLAPAVAGSRIATLATALRDRSAAALGSGARLRKSLVVIEVALSFVLLIGAGLMAKSFIELHRTDLGFDPNDLLTFEVTLPPQRYPDGEERHRFQHALRERIAALPGVVSVAAATPLPLTGQQFHGRFSSEPPTGDDAMYGQANYRVVQPGYFETMRTPLLAGRELSNDDDTTGHRVAVIDSVIAAASWPGADAVGKHVWLRLDNPEPVPFEVVGVVHRQLQDGVHGPERGTVYLTPGAADQFAGNAWAVRTAVPPESIVPLLRRELAALDPSLPLAQVRTMGALVEASTARTRFSLTLMSVFATAALVIASVGLYAAIHHLVRARRAEIGIRVSFGARPSDIFVMFLRHGLALAAGGIALGLIAAAMLTTLIGRLIAQVAATDPATYVAVAGLFVAVAAVACAIPSLRAARTDAMTVLRND